MDFRLYLGYRKPNGKDDSRQKKTNETRKMSD